MTGALSVGALNGVMVGGGPQADPYADYLVYATFTGQEALALADYTPEKDVEGGGFVEEVGSWAIASNQARVDANVDQNEYATIDAGQSDCTIECELILTDDGAIDHNIGLVFRFADTNNWFIFFQDINDGNLIFGKYVSAAWTAISSDAHVWASGAKTFKIVLSGNDVTCYVDDVEITSTSTSDNNTNTKHGFFQRRTITQRWDNLTVVE